MKVKLLKDYYLPLKEKGKRFNVSRAMNPNMVPKGTVLETPEICPWDGSVRVKWSKVSFCLLRPEWELVEE